MPKLDEQISTLEERLKQLKQRHQHIEARKKAIQSKRDRKADTRRKILIGAVVMAKTEQKVLDEQVLRGWLNGLHPVWWTPPLGHRGHLLEVYRTYIP
jgi:chromosome segregation ATPase